MSRTEGGSLLIAAVALALSTAAQAGPYNESGYAPALMQAWATEVDDFQRGPRDIADPGGGNASHGVPEWALGAFTNNNSHVFSLGDGGHLTLFFETGIGDGPDDDFAVYENGFFAPGGFFGEFAFVEVSSNGVDFARFAATCLQATPVSGGAVVDETDYDNLGGKHPLGQGTGFDLAELAEHPLVTGGEIALQYVAYVRLIDVIGDGSTHDRTGAPVYDPYPTAYATGGFDADAVGVLHLPEPDAIAMLAAGASCLFVLSPRRRRTPCARTL